MTKKKISVICSYCGRDSFYIYHRKKQTKTERKRIVLGKIDWAICFECLKKFCDKVLKEGENGGRIKD